jgi:hypothetical protein
LGLIEENQHEYRSRTGIITVIEWAGTVHLFCSNQLISSTLARRYSTLNSLAFRIRYHMYDLLYLATLGNRGVRLSIQTYIYIYIYIYIHDFLQTFEKFIKCYLIHTVKINRNLTTLTTLCLPTGVDLYRAHYALYIWIISKVFIPICKLQFFNYFLRQCRNKDIFVFNKVRQDKCI